MSIKLRNQGEYVVTLTVPGTQVVAATAAALSPPLPFSGIIKAVYAVLGTAGTTNTQLTDLQKNGTTIVGSGVLFNFATTSKAATYGTLSTNPTTVAKGDLLRLITSAAHTTPALDLAVAVVIQRLRGTGPDGAMETDTYGADNDAIS